MGRPHIVLSATPLWSHSRALCVLAAKIILQKDVDVTFLVSNFFTTPEKVNAEVKRTLEDAECEPKGKIRIIVVGEEVQNPMEAASADPVSFKPIWEALLAEQPVVCARSKTEHGALSSPVFALLDGFQYPWFKVIRAHQPCPPVYVWVTGFSGGLLRIFGPEKMGGVGDILRSIDDSMTTQIPTKLSGTIAHVPGLPAMYDWEFSVQFFPPFSGNISPMECNFAKFVVEADGLASTCAEAYDGQCLVASDEWYKEMKKPTFHLGPVIPFKLGTTQFSQRSLDAEIAATPGGMSANRVGNIGEAIVQFLDSALEKHGAHSVVYISFGTLFWPSNGEHVELLLKTFEKRGIPFVLSHASPLAKLSEELKTHFENSAMGFLSPWSPQQTILAHKAVGWFLTHGGFNGTMEALTQGVPMIGWPFLADQPANIMHLKANLDVAFELLEVRTGENGQKPILQSGFVPSGTLEAIEKELNGVIDDMQGPVGARKRANAKKAQAELAKAWSAEGAAQKAFDRLMDGYTVG